jgi:hypothetical protein
MKICFHIKDKRVTDLLHGHGGRYSPWLHELSGKWTDPKGFRIHYDREHDAEGAGTGRGRIGRRKVMRGLTLMALGSPTQFCEFLTENDDDVTFDTALQYIVFGKLIYG